MTKYITAICCVIIIFEILSALIPEGEIKKYCLCAARLVVLFVIIAPLVSFFSQNFTVNSDIFSSRESYTQSETGDIYKNYIEEMYERNGYFGQ